MSKTLVGRAASSVAALTAFATSLMLVGCTAPASLLSSTNATTAGQVVPAPVATSEATAIPLPAEASPPPSVTPEPPPVQEPLPTPPLAVSLPSDSILTPNIAWGVQSKDRLTIWVGSSTDKTTFNVSKSAPIVQWNRPLTLLDMAVSPDRQSLAVLTVDSTLEAESGPVPTWLSVIDLNSNSVRSVPDYNNKQLYEGYFYSAPSKILGWVDNDRFAIQQGNEGPAIASRNGTSYANVPLPVRSNATDTALSPDRTTFFSSINGKDGGFWLYSIDGSNPRKLIDWQNARPLYSPIWSPDGKRLCFLSPKLETKEGATFPNFKNMGLWLLDLDTKSQKSLSGESGWDVAPAWSVDNTKIAFLRSAGSDTSNVSYFRPQKIETSVFIVDLDGSNLHQLTGSTGRNSRLQWTEAGSVLLSSTAANTSALPSLVVMSPDGVVATQLVPISPGESVVYPTMLK